VSSFDSILAPVDGVVDNVFSDAFDFMPMRTVVNGHPVSDASRETLLAVRAIIDQPLMANESRPPRTTVNTCIHVIRNLLPWEPRRGDRLLSNKTGLAYEVSKAYPDAIRARWRLEVVGISLGQNLPGAIVELGLEAA
jgi:hypothetical protein